MLPAIYFDMMLKGTETLAEPNILSHRPADHEAQPALSNKVPARVA
jgi:sulfide:quinone oxidoreductase